MKIADIHVLRISIVRNLGTAWRHLFDITVSCTSIGISLMSVVARGGDGARTRTGWDGGAPGQLVYII